MSDGRIERLEVRMAGSAWSSSEGRGLWAEAVGPRLVAFGCAVYLLLTIVAPRELARPTWAEARPNGDLGTRINDSPAGYVGLVSLCGLAALVALLVRTESWRGVIAAAGATVAFAIGAWVTGTYVLGFPRGDRLLEARERLGPDAAASFPLLLPLFAFAAVVGLVSALALTIYRWQDGRSAATAGGTTAPRAT